MFPALWRSSSRQSWDNSSASSCISACCRCSQCSFGITSTS